MMRTVICAFVLLTILAACDERTPSYPQREPPPGFLENLDNRAVGNALFHEHCSRCHGTSEEGRSLRADFFQPPARDFRNPSSRNLGPAYLYWRIETGKTVEPYLSRGSVMPAYGRHLSEEQIWQLVAYLRTRPTGDN